MTIEIQKSPKFRNGGDPGPFVWSADAPFTEGSSVLVYFFGNDFDTSGAASAVDVEGTVGTLVGTFANGNACLEIWRADDITGGGDEVTITPVSAGGLWAVGCIHEFDTIGDLVTWAAKFDNDSSDPNNFDTSTGSPPGTPAIGQLLITLVGQVAQVTLPDPDLISSFDSVALGSGLFGYGAWKFVTVDGVQTITYHDGGGNELLGIAVFESGGPPADMTIDDDQIITS